MVFALHLLRKKIFKWKIKIRKEYGADIKIISKTEALKIGPNINNKINAAFCEMDGYVSANQTDAYTKALKENNVEIIENFEVSKIENLNDIYEIIDTFEKINSTKIVLATELFRKSFKIKILTLKLNASTINCNWKNAWTSRP